MNWSKVKNLLIAILIAANLFLIYNIQKQDRTRGYLDESEIQTAITLLADRGMIVSRDGIPLRKFSADVYESEYDERYYNSTAEAISGSTANPPQMLPDGSSSITMTNGDLVELDSEFGFSLTKNGILRESAYTDITEADYERIALTGSEIPASRMKKLTETAMSFLASSSETDQKLRADIAAGCYDTKTGYGLLLAYQTIDGYRIHSHYAVCVFLRDELVYACGRWYFAPVGSSYQTELQDQVNVLFTDLKTQREKASVSSDALLPAVNSMSPCYAVYWNAQKTSIFFIPAWHIEHNDGTSSAYNAANGTEYSKS